MLAIVFSKTLDDKFFFSIPSFSVINQYGGRTFAVYQPESGEHFRQVYDLQEQGRVQGIGEANYKPGSQTYLWLHHTAERIATRIVQDRKSVLSDVAKPPPRHIVQESYLGTP